MRHSWPWLENVITYCMCIWKSQTRAQTTQNGSKMISHVGQLTFIGMLLIQTTQQNPCLKKKKKKRFSKDKWLFKQIRVIWLLKGIVHPKIKIILWFSPSSYPTVGVYDLLSDIHNEAAIHNHYKPWKTKVIF